jgi:hypothetical protein
VGNNPINATDPSGHKCVGEPDECLQDDGTKGSGFTGTGGSTSGKISSRPSCSGKSCIGKTSRDSYGDGLFGPPASVYGNGLYGPPAPIVYGPRIPDNWTLDPREADYRSSVFNTYVLAIIYSTDRYDRHYLAIGGTWNIKSVSPIGYSYVIGSVGSAFDNKIANRSDLEKFMTGVSFNFTAGALAGGGTSFNPSTFIENGFHSESKPSSMETGLYLVPSVGLTAALGFSLDK